MFLIVSARAFRFASSPFNPAQCFCKQRLRKTLVRPLRIHVLFDEEDEIEAEPTLDVVVALT